MQRHMHMGYQLKLGLESLRCVDQYPIVKLDQDKDLRRDGDCDYGHCYIDHLQRCSQQLMLEHAYMGPRLRPNATIAVVLSWNRV